MLIECFGGLRLSSSTQKITLRYAKSEALLCYLTVTAKTVRRSELTGLLWSSLDERKALANLRVVLSDLRRFVRLESAGDRLWVEPARALAADCSALTEAWAIAEARSGPAGGVGTVSGYGVATPGGVGTVSGYGVATPGGVGTVSGYGVATPGGAGDTSALPLSSHDVSVLQRACEQYRGRFLEGFVVDGAEGLEEWIAERSDHYHRIAVGILHALSKHFLISGQLRSALVSAERLVQLEPWHEEARRRLMIALSAAAEPEAAVAEYFRLRDALRKEMGTGPSAESAALAESIANLHSPRLGPRPLPLPATPIIGREKESAELAFLLKTPGLVSLTGPGGVGKTRLALEAALHHPTSVFADLSGHDHAVHIAAIVAAELGRTLTGIRDKLDELCTIIGDSAMMVVLDNIEQMLPDAASVVSRLQTRCPHLVLLATSRVPLGVVGERRLHVEPLAAPAAPSDAQRNPALALFLERARAAGREVTAAETADAVTLCHRLDGLPLAIEIVASRSRFHLLGEMLDHLWDFGDSALSDVPERHRSIDASIAWSYRLLDPEAQQLLRFLSVLPSGADLEVVRSVLVPGLLPERALASLLDSGLVEPRRSTSSIRLTMTEAVRNFADRQLIDQEERARAFSLFFTGIPGSAHLASHVDDIPLRLAEDLARLSDDEIPLRLAEDLARLSDDEIPLQPAEDLARLSDDEIDST